MPEAMPEVVEVSVSQLLFDAENARLSIELQTQPEIALALAQRNPGQILTLAEDIVKFGTDPTALVAVMPTPDRMKKYIVLEGNRRVLALRALDTPSLINPALPAAMVKRLVTLSGRFATDPVDRITCVLFESREDADHWVELRHTGYNEGAGLVEWGSAEKDRFVARSGQKKPAGQVIDFVEEHGDLSAEARVSKRGIYTNVVRVLSTPELRESLGIDVVEGTVVSMYPKEEVLRGLTHIVDELKTGALQVKDIYHAPDRRQVAAELPRSVKPRKTKKLKAPVTLADLASGAAPKAATPARKRARRRRMTTRTTLIPRESQIDISNPRINLIYNELLVLNLETYPNAVSVAFRVFLELSVDHYVTEKTLMTEAQRRKDPLSKRMKTAAADLRKRKIIDAQLEAMVKKVADSSSLLSASTVTMNQYVHNKYVFPKPSDLRHQWDEVQPFVEALWSAG